MSVRGRGGPGQGPPGAPTGRGRGAMSVRGGPRGRGAMSVRGRGGRGSGQRVVMPAVFVQQGGALAEEQGKQIIRTLVEGNQQVETARKLFGVDYELPIFTIMKKLVFFAYAESKLPKTGLEKEKEDRNKELKVEQDKLSGLANDIVGNTGKDINDVINAAEEYGANEVEIGAKTKYIEETGGKIRAMRTQMGLQETSRGERDRLKAEVKKLQGGVERAEAAKQTTEAKNDLLKRDIPNFEAARDKIKKFKTQKAKVAKTEEKLGKAKVETPSTTPTKTTSSATMSKELSQIQTDIEQIRTDITMMTGRYSKEKLQELHDKAKQIAADFKMSIEKGERAAQIKGDILENRRNALPGTYILQMQEGVASLVNYDPVDDDGSGFKRYLRLAQQTLPGLTKSGDSAKQAAADASAAAVAIAKFDAVNREITKLSISSGPSGVTESVAEGQSAAPGVLGTGAVTGGPQGSASFATTATVVPGAPVMTASGAPLAPGALGTRAATGTPQGSVALPGTGVATAATVVPGAPVVTASGAPRHQRRQEQHSDTNGSGSSSDTNGGSGSDTSGGSSAQRHQRWRRQQRPRRPRRRRRRRRKKPKKPKKSLAQQLLEANKKISDAGKSGGGSHSSRRRVSGGMEGQDVQGESQGEGDEGENDDEEMAGQQENYRSQGQGGGENAADEGQGGGENEGDGGRGKSQRRRVEGKGASGENEGDGGRGKSQRHPVGGRGKSQRHRVGGRGKGERRRVEGDGGSEGCCRCCKTERAGSRPCCSSSGR